MGVLEWQSDSAAYRDTKSRQKREKKRKSGYPAGCIAHLANGPALSKTITKTTHSRAKIAALRKYGQLSNSGGGMRKKVGRSTLSQFDAEHAGRPASPRTGVLHDDHIRIDVRRRVPEPRNPFPCFLKAPRISCGFEEKVVMVRIRRFASARRFASYFVGSGQVLRADSLV
jgi:hypothetical protein